MKPLDPSERTDNLKGKRFCHGCKDHAVIAVETHLHCDAEYEGYAPCPFCLRGHRLEYGDDSPWAPDGYWQGRDLDDDLVEAWVAAQQPQRQMSQREQLAAIRRLGVSLIGTLDAEIEPRTKAPA